MHRVLVVDDDHVQVDVVSFLLRRSGFEALAAFDAQGATRLFNEQPPDLVILDIHLGETDGRELLRQFRRQRSDVLILMLTAVSAEDDRVQGLELGADDYLTKPFSHRELIARVQALFRRSTNGAHESVPARPMHVGSVVLDPVSHEVSKDGTRVDLTPTEFRLLETLMSRPNAVVSTRVLLKEVWGHQDMTARNVLRVTASRLRAKLQDDALGPRFLQTVAGEGLMVRADQAQHDIRPPEPGDPPVALSVIADLQELLGDGDMQPLQDLNEVYARTAAKHIVAIHALLTTGEISVLAEEAHRLRGASATMGAQRISQLCAAIEECCRTNQLDDLENLTRQLDEELAAFEDAVTPLVKGSSVA